MRARLRRGGWQAPVGGAPSARRRSPAAVPAHVTCVAAPDLDAAFAALRARGLRRSSARRAVLHVLFDGGGARTAEEMGRTAAGRDGCDLASVYRNLEVLEAA